MVLRVQYQNDKYDYIGTNILDRLLKKESLIGFLPVHRRKMGQCLS